MIAYLKGKIKNKGQGYVILEIRDIGYKVYVNETLCTELDIGQPSEFYIYQNIRENASDLYGFLNLEQLELFELLLSISGVGPKSAIGAMSAAKVEDVKDSIARGDPSLLTKVSGIGKKTAERIVLELRTKISCLSGVSIPGQSKGASASADEIDALLALGYSLQQARSALRQVDPNIKDSGERIKAALRDIGK
ncbi:Holliday junction branch migration protein RuvA [bacterium]|nr:Holliday junction branch migration protein RuvA [bacterium]